MITSKNIFFIITVIILIVSGFNKTELENIKNKEFKNITTPTVKLIENNNTYFILSTSFKHFKTDRENKIKKNLTILGKSLLFKKIKKSDEDINSITLKNFSFGIMWNKANKYYLLSYISRKNVILVKNSVKTVDKQKIKTISNKKNNETITNYMVSKNLSDEIQDLKNSINKSPKSLDIYKLLYEYHKINGDLDNANKIMDKIIELKFETGE